MNPPSPRSILGYLAALFVAGLAIGGATGYILGMKLQSRFPTALEFEAGWLTKYQSELALTDEQVRAIQPLLPEAVERLGRIWFQAIMTMGAVHESVDRKVEPFLDDRQRAKLVRWIKNGRERRLWLARGKLDEQVRADSDIWAAAKHGNIEAISRHLANGVEMNEPDLGFGMTPLSVAAIHGQTKAVELLLSQGANVNARNRDGNTALHGAAFFGQLAPVQLLVQNGADVNARNDRGETPLDPLAADWELIQFIGDILQVELDKEKIVAGRKAAAELLRARGAEIRPAPKANGNPNG